MSKSSMFPEFIQDMGEQFQETFDIDKADLKVIWSLRFVKNRLAQTGPVYTSVFNRFCKYESSSNYN
jgi:hypothetical protein